MCGRNESEIMRGCDYSSEEQITSICRVKALALLMQQRQLSMSVALLCKIGFVKLHCMEMLSGELHKKRVE